MEKCTLHTVTQSRMPVHQIRTTVHLFLQQPSQMLPTETRPSSPSVATLKQHSSVTTHSPGPALAHLLTRLPADLPPPYSNALAEIVGAHYGLKQSNNIYDQDFLGILTSHDYTRCPSSPYTLTKSNGSPNNNCLYFYIFTLLFE